MMRHLNIHVAVAISSLVLSIVGVAVFGPVATNSNGCFALDVIDLRGSDEATRLLALSLQGIVNREKPQIYVLWESKDSFGNPSEEWLKYYKSKGWITYTNISLLSAIKKYANKINGFVVYDPNFRHTINIATTIAGLNDTLIAHPDFIPQLESMGIELKEDLRGRWNDKYEAYEWQLKKLFPYCSKEIIASAMPVEDPFTHRPVLGTQRPIRDYVIMHRAAALDLIPSRKFERDYELLEKYYEQMGRFAVVLGYPYPHIFERPHVELASKFGLLTVLAASTAVDFSVHSQMPAQEIYKQDHRTSFSLNRSKIYIALGMSDLGLNTMHDRYYGAWDDPRRGNIPVSWWLDGIVKDFCPGIVQYYYETKTHNDFFYGAHVGGRIRPSDFPDLEGYLKRGKKYLEDCDLNTVGFSNHGKYDYRVFENYSKVLDNCIGFFYGWPQHEFGQEGSWFIIDGKPWIVTAVGIWEKDVDEAVEEISSFIEQHGEKPLFMVVLVVLGIYPDIGFLNEVKERIDSLYPGQVEWVRGDELILAVKEAAKNLSVSIEEPEEGYLYIFDKKIAKIPSERAMIIGKVTIKVRVSGNVSRIEFYIDDELKSVDSRYSYEWLWDERIFGKHVIKVIAYDGTGNRSQDKTDVIIFNFGR